MKLPPGLDSPSCAGTKSVEGVRSSASMSQPNGVRKKNPGLGEPHVPAQKRRCVPGGECVPLYPDVCSPEQEIKIKSSGTNVDMEVTFSKNSALIDSNFSSTFQDANHQALFAESSEVVHIDTTRHLRSQDQR